MMMGKPYVSVKALTSSYFSTAPGVPGTTGTLAALASFRAETLSPRESMTLGDGPTNWGLEVSAQEPEKLVGPTRDLR